ncbi:MAG: MFS transporter [Candidatus Bathycorpusculaceae bacterium]
MSAKTNKQKILGITYPFNVLNKDLKLVFASNLVGSFGDGLYAYILPYYVTKNLGASTVEVGILYAIVGLVAAVTLFLAGLLADKYDRKKIMIAGWAAWVPAPLIFSFAGDWFQTLPGMILWGFWLGGPTSTAYIVTAADKRNLTLTFTVLSSAWSFGYIFSPALGGYIAEKISMQIVFYLASFFYTLACLTLLLINSQRAISDVQTSGEKSHFATATMIKFSILFAAIMFIMLLFRPFVPQFLADIYHYGEFEIGVLGSVAFLGSAILGIILGRVGDKWKKSYALATSMGLCSLSLCLLMAFGNFYILTITFFLTGSSYITWSLMSAIIGPAAPESFRARWVSIPQTISMLSSTIAPYVGGILYHEFSYYPFIAATATTAFLALLLTTKAFK